MALRLAHRPLVGGDCAIIAGCAKHA